MKIKRTTKRTPHRRFRNGDRDARRDAGNAADASDTLAEEHPGNEILWDASHDGDARE